MASQKYTNLAQSLIPAGYTAGTTSITVTTGEGALFPSSGDFIVAIDSPPAFFLKCTARSGDVLTVSSTGQEGTTAANKGANIAITQVVTAGVLDSIRSDHSKYDTAANLPSTGESHKGDRYSESDHQLDHVFDGSAWQTVPRGSLILLEQHTASSSAELDFTSWYSSLYDEYMIECINLIPATNGVNVTFQYSINGGSSYLATGYTYSIAVQGTSADSGVQGSNSATSIILSSNDASTGNTAAGGGLSATLKLYGPAGAQHKSLLGDCHFYHTNGFHYRVAMSGYNTNSSAVNAFRVLMSSGNIASGIVRVYGISK